MRVIRTEFYFDSTDLVAVDGIKTPKFPGISVAWFKGRHAKSLGRKEAAASDEAMLGFQFDPLFQKRVFLDAALYDLAAPDLPGGVRNERIVNYLLDQDVVVERSPPVMETLRSLLTHGTNVSIGSYMGYALAGGDIPLMFITVPAGVIVMGAAIGVSTGLKNGLQRTVERLFAGETLPLLPGTRPSGSGRHQQRRG